ncbi:hypothetical protein M9H77_07901 [Catharanthus roseus]|uniref:Uncharacterized protein n=1 Tax=Catharanthus roseus TaxID=4058 RepID=A0ACC0BWA1_CATRO|nr:hypothetical protein M9H77_07901 [Catharanthus roseus]
MLTIGPAPTVAGRLLDRKCSEDHALPCLVGIEDEGMSMEEELGTILENLSISLSLNPSLSLHEVSFVELNLRWFLILFMIIQWSNLDVKRIKSHEEFDIPPTAGPSPTVTRDEKLQGPITRARARRIKEKDDQIAHGFMIAIKEPMKEGLRFKNKSLEDDGNPPKFLIVQCLNLE